MRLAPLPPKALYVVDAALTDLSTLLCNIPKDADVELIYPASDGVDQLLAILEARQQPYQTIHVVSHGDPGRIVLGDRAITLETLEARGAEMARIGDGLSADGELLIYACRLASGETGRAFVERLTELTGAYVAASETLTGATELGGDWNLQVHTGAIKSTPFAALAYNHVLAAPQVDGATNLTVTEGDAPVGIDNGLTFSGGSNFIGGSLRVGFSTSDAGDQLVLTSAADVNAAGAISLDGSTVYLGNGAGRDVIGVIDSVENGQDGAALTIQFTGTSTGALSNPSFETGLTGWTVGTTLVDLGVTVINGVTSPNDPTNPPRNSGDDASNGLFTFSSELSSSQHTDGAQSLRLFNNGSTQSYGVVHGPYAYSETFAAEAGQDFRFDWKAAGGQDAYDAFAYLVNADTGVTTIIIDQTGSGTGATPWYTSNVPIAQDGNYFLVFVAGTYDETGGMAAGGSLYIDNFRVLEDLVTDAVVKSIAGQITYQNTSDAPVDGDRQITISVEDGGGDTQSDSAVLSMTAINDAPTGSVTISGRVAVGQTLTAANSLDDADGFDPAQVSYQWQRGGGSNWSDIRGATSSTYTISNSDEGRALRVVARYTDDGGTAEAVPSAATVSLPSPQPQQPGSGFDDVISGSAGNDVINAFTGDDRVFGREGDDVLNGNQGNDLVQGNQGNDTVHGGQGDDTVHGGQGDDYVSGDLGNDWVFGDAGNDTVRGGDGNDTMQGGQGDDMVFGDLGDDILRGGQGNDVLQGGDGNDFLSGDLGDDTLFGGAGADIFYGFSQAGSDYVADFNLAEGDRVMLAIGTAYTLRQAGADAVIELTGGGSITLAGVQSSTLVGDWLTFG